MPVKQHTGGCHCGQVRYEVTLDLDNLVTCNCSICTKTGAILSGVPADQFKLNSGQDMLSDYTFNKHVIHHHFCPDCGIRSFSRGKGPDGSEMVAVNVRCLDKIDVDALKPMKFDGRSI
jgi:hypothetical protein